MVETFRVGFVKQVAAPVADDAFKAGRYSNLVVHLPVFYGGDRVVGYAKVATKYE